jgi:hypothetical protein
MAKKDDRKIQLDPMEWRDAMKGITPKAPAKVKKAKPGKKRGSG